MKFPALSLVLALFALVSCGQEAGDSFSSAEGSAPLEESSSFVYEEGVSYSFSSFAETLPLLGEVYGEQAAAALPSYPASSYEVTLSRQGTGDILVASLSCKEVSAKAIELYPIALEGCGYRVVLDSGYAYQKASVTEDRILEFALSSSENLHNLDLLLYVYPSREPSWPSDFVDVLVGEDAIPPFEGEAYAAAYFPEGYGLIEVYGVDESALVAYERSLTGAGLTLASEDAYSSRFLGLDGTLTLTLYLSYDAYDAPMALLRLENAWPRVYLLSLLDEDLPRLDLSTHPFEYAFVGESETLTLYFDASSYEDYVSYASLLETQGYVPYDQGSYESEALSSTIHYSYARKGGKELAVLYNEASQTIAVPVYGGN